MVFRKISGSLIGAGIGLGVGGALGYWTQLKNKGKLPFIADPVIDIDPLNTKPSPIDSEIIKDPLTIIYDLDNDILNTGKVRFWKKIYNLRFNKIVQGATIGLGVGLILSNYSSIIGSTILKASPQILTYINEPQKLNKLALNRLKEIVEIRQKMRYDTAMRLVNDPDFTPMDIIDMFKRRLREVKEMASGPNKTRVLLTLISLITFVILSNTLKFSSLISLLGDLMKEINLNNEPIVEFTITHNNKTLEEIISDLVNSNLNITHLES